MKTEQSIQDSEVDIQKLTEPWCLGFLVVCLLSVAASSQPYSTDWYTIDGGGGTSTNGQFALSGTIGQPDAGAMTGGTYTIQGGFWSLYMAIQTPGAPTLTIKRVGGNVEISWSAEAAGFGLQQTGDLNPTISWLGVGITPTVVEGQKVVTLPVQAGHHFFRLYKLAD